MAGAFFATGIRVERDSSFLEIHPQNQNYVVEVVQIGWCIMYMYPQINPQMHLRFVI